MNDIEIIVGVVIGAIIFGAVCYLLAGVRELNQKQWFLFGLFLGPLALLVLVLFPKNWLAGFEKQ